MCVDMDKQTQRALSQHRTHTHGHVTTTSREDTHSRLQRAEQLDSHADRPCHEPSSAPRGSERTRGGTSCPVEEPRAEGETDGGGGRTGHRQVAPQSPPPNGIDDMGDAPQPGHEEKESTPRVLPVGSGPYSEWSGNDPGPPEASHGKDLPLDRTRWPGPDGFWTTCQPDLCRGHESACGLLHLGADHSQRRTTQPATWQVCQVAEHGAQGPGKNATLPGQAVCQVQRGDRDLCEGRARAQRGTDQLNTSPGRSPTHDDKDDGDHGRDEGRVARVARGATPEEDRGEERGQFQPGEQPAQVSDVASAAGLVGSVEEESPETNEKTVTTISDSMARFFEQESQNLGPKAFQELLNKETVLLEVACSPESRLSSEVQKVLGRETAAVRCSHWNGCDLETGEGVKHCIKLIDQLDPGHVWLSPECGPYSPMQAINQRTPEQVAELAGKRKRALKQYVGASCMFQYCCQKGIHVTWELAERCQAWRLPMLQKLMKKYQPYTAVTHGCRVNLRDPRTETFLHKGWKLMTTHAHLADTMNQRCNCAPGYQHAKCDGGIARSTAYYTPEFAKRAVKPILQELTHEKLLREIDGRTCLPCNFGEGIACVCHSLREHAVEMKCGACVVPHASEEKVCDAQSQQDPPREQQPPRQQTDGTDMDQDKTETNAETEMACGVQQLKNETNEEEIKRKLYLLHASTGYSNTRNLVTALQKRGASARIIQLAKDFRCSVCHEGKKIGSKHVASLEPLPPKLMTISADGAKWNHPDSHEDYEFVVVIDEGSRYRTAKVMKKGKHQTMNAGQVVEYLRDGWFQFFGTPNVLRLDPAGAFRSREIEHMCDQHEIYLDVIPGEAHWKLGTCEQAVKGLKMVMTKLAEGDPEKDPEDLLTVAVKTFNEREMVRGFSPCQHVLGRAPDETGRFVTPENHKGHELMVPNPGEDCVEGIQLRKQAEQALAEWQAEQRINRGMNSRAKPKYDYYPGDMVYFWRKQVSGKNPGKNGMFMGPARILATEKHRDGYGNLKESSSIWLVRGRRLIKCCPEQLRPASEREELLEFLGNPEENKAPWNFTRVASALGGNEMDDITGEIPDLATWQRDQQNLVRQNPKVRHWGKRPVDPTRDGGTGDPFSSGSRGEPKHLRTSGPNKGLMGEHLEEAWWIQVPDDVYHESKGEHFWENPEASVQIEIPIPETKRGMSRMAEDLGGYFVNQLKRRAVEVSEKRLTPKEREEFREAKHKEVTNYLAAQAFEAIPPELRPSRDQTIGMRWILTWKRTDDGDIRLRPGLF